MSQIRIVEYERRYAKALAEMWNQSGSNWGGFDLVYTEETIIQEVEGSTNLHNWLALDGDEVVGYCSFSEYREDEGASYIPLLNVRPDYHNRKVGKALVLRAVERAIESPWPRLDLYTWPGNTKAVPLYKKCGFVWEKRDDSTHLMCFIPLILGTEAVADFFQQADWYQDSTRPLDVEPDDLRINGFDYYQYTWNYQGRELKMEFERRARGLRLIETQDYLVSCETDLANLPFGREYPVRYILENKSGKPLNVQIKGQDDKCISFDLEYSGTVTERTVVEGRFEVNPISEDQDPRRTHPAITAEILINGKKALFRLGIAPKYPAKLGLVLPETICQPGQEGELYLDVVNNFNCQADFNLTLPSTPWLTLPQEAMTISLKGEARTSLSLPYNLQALGFYNQDVPVTAVLESGEKVTFSLPLSQPFAGSGAGFGGTTDKAWQVYNGLYFISLSKFNNMLLVSALNKDGHESFYFYPQAGKPWSAEFSKCRPQEVHWFSQGSAMVLEATWVSEDFPGLAITMTASLEADGLVSHHYTLANQSGSELRDVNLKHGARIPFHRSTIPVRGRIISVENALGDGSGYWPATDLSENWVFSDLPVPRGLVWPQGAKLISEHGIVFIEHELGSLAPGQSIVTEAVYLSAGAFRTWQELRAFALGGKQAAPAPSKFLNLTVNHNNPFVGQSFTAVLEEQRNASIVGDIQLRAENGSFPPASQHLAKELNCREARFDLRLNTSPPVEQVNLSAELESFDAKRQAVIFPLTGSVRVKSEKVDCRQIWSASNGPLTIKTCPDMSGALYSLEWQGVNWLDNSFPEVGPKSWWNPWLGGISWTLSQLTFRTILASPRRAEAVELKDSKGNPWQGISMITLIHDNEDYRGVEVRQNFLLLPGVPVLAVVSEIRQNSGRTLREVDFENEFFYSPGGVVQGSWNISQGFDGEALKTKAVENAIDVDTKDVFWHGSPRSKGTMMTLFNGRLYGMLNSQVNGGFTSQVMTIPHGQTIFTKPMFLVLSEEKLALKAVTDLLNLSF